MSVWSYLGIIGPTLAGAAIMYRPRANFALTLGAGWLLGQVLVMSFLYAAFRVTGASQAKTIAAGLFAAGIVLGAWKLKRPTDATESSIRVNRRSDSHHQPKNRRAIAGRIAVTILVVSMTAKLWSIVPTVADVPTRSDDAISMWLFKAKVVAVTNHLSFKPTDDFYLGGSNPRYPVFLPLLAAFVPLLEGGWNETLAALPWIGFFIAMPLTVAGAIYARLRSLVPAAICAYVIASFPLASIHAYRPGYADLPLATFLAAAVAFALLADDEKNRPRFLAFAVAMLAGAAAMKREGPVMAAVVGIVAILPLVWHVIRDDRRRAALAVAVAIIGIAVVTLLVDVSDIRDNARQLQFHPEAFVPLVRHAFTWASFNLAFWLLPVALTVVWLSPRAPGRMMATTLTFALIGVIVSIFVLTPQYVFAMNDQTPSRLFLQVLPAIVVAMTVPLTAAATRRSEV